jgi:hypothetical protein
LVRYAGLLIKQKQHDYLNKSGERARRSGNSVSEQYQPAVPAAASAARRRYRTWPFPTPESIIASAASGSR